MLGNQSKQGRLPLSQPPPPETHIQDWGGGADPSSIREEEGGAPLDFIPLYTLKCKLAAVHVMQMNHARSKNIDSVLRVGFLSWFL